MFKIIAVVIVVMIAGVLLFAATRPDMFQVQREADIKAPPEKILALLNDFHRWEAWSPWEKMDPAMKRAFGGSASGRGATYAWESDKVGHGKMEILETTPALVKIKLDFLKPMEAHNTAEFALTPQGDATRVTWAMSGDAPYLSKLMQVFVSMDKMVGKDFEAGLANMKASAEK